MALIAGQKVRALDLVDAFAARDLGHQFAHISGSLESTSSTVYTNLATFGPTFDVTLSEARPVLIMINADMFQSAGGTSPYASWATSGATTIAASDNWSIRHGGAGTGRQRYSSSYVATLQAGTTTVAMKYRVDSGTGQFNNRAMVVIQL